MKPELPEIRQAEITESEALDLCRDLEIFCNIESLRLRGANEGDETSLSLTEARSLIREGLPGALQIRYGYDGVDWIDTLVPRDAHLHLTRIALDLP